MAFLHCHKCGWSQDDFWSTESYNPLFGKEYLGEILMRKDWIKVDETWLRDTTIPFSKVRQVRVVKQRDELEPCVFGQPESALIEHDQCEVEPQAYVIESLRRMTRKIEGMRWRTFEEFRDDREAGRANCPRCGSQGDFDID